MSRYRSCWIVCLSFFLSSCVLGDVASVTHPSISGLLKVTGRDGASASWTPDTCQSGAVEYFVGFDFLSSTTGQLRALVDPLAGPAVRWKPDASQPQRTVVFRSGDCSKLDIAVQPTGWRVNDVREFAGHVDLQCRSADGLSLEGRISVDHCH